MTRPRYNAPPADYSVLKVTTGSGWLTVIGSAQNGEAGGLGGDALIVFSGLRKISGSAKKGP